MSIVRDNLVTLNKSYVLITPARNEDAYIEKTIKSVIEQSVLPQKWIIVDDGSSDSTPEVVKKYEERYEFIRLINKSKYGDRNFGSKVRAFSAGFEAIKEKDFEFIGNLDADVSFGRNYYESLIEEFNKNQRIGIVGGVILELINGRYVIQNTSSNSVAGPVQFFRRECYEAIGGYIPIRFGGIDAAAEIMARFKGWEVKTLPHLQVLHHRRMVTGKNNIFLTKFYQGMQNFRLGYHPLFQIASSLFRMSDRPYIFGGAMMMAGYLWSFLRGDRKILPGDIREFLRFEQKERIKRMMIKGEIFQAWKKNLD